MGSDTAMVNGSGLRDAGRKKKTHRSAKLKQCKRDARREQWLSQVNRSECRETNEHTSPSPPLSPSVTVPQGAKLARGNRPEMRNIGDEIRGSQANQAHSPPVPIDILRNSCWGDSLDKDCYPNNSFGGHSSSNSSCWRSDVEDDREDADSRGGEEGSLDDWEAFADALTSNDDDSRHNPRQDSNNGASTESIRPALLHNNAGRGILKTPEPNKMVLRAWRPDDVYRPQSLPNLSKQRTHPMDLQRHCIVGTMERALGGCAFQPLSCPICCEDLDVTDSSFLPCSCGFRLCLFCHKRILEADCRCPGCRKIYTQAASEDVTVKGPSPLLPVRPRSLGLRF